ncbi:MAG TPA: hypothetical protein VF121_00400 [Thermoanaerobaculia bacterium]|nr:hypothetical protein [Thermoanaerobaculia bacterium]
MPPAIEKLLALARSPEGAGQPVWLVQGDLVLAEPAAARLAAALAERAGCAAESHRRPPSLLPLLADLRTYSLFGGGKVVLVVDSAALADRNAAAELLADAEEALPVDPSRPLGARERHAASRLLQALRLCDLDPERGAAEEVVSRLLAAVVAAGGEGRSKPRKGSEERRGQLAALLEAARREGLQGWGESALAELVDVVQSGLPPGHTLVLAERVVAGGHPLARLLAERGTLARAGEVEAARDGGWDGADLLAAELARQTGVAIERDALAELTRRTLRQESGWRRESRGVDADSTARLAGEYRKLAELARGSGAARIERRLVEEAVEDRGEEDVWQVLDAAGAGRAGEALDRLRRLVASAEDPQSARLAFFGLFASFCRQLTAVSGMMRLARVPGGETHYPRFRDRHAPALQGELPAGGKNPLAGLHPFRLHRAYLAASRLPAPLLARLPAEVLETELQMKGESGEADVALARLVAHVAGAARA